VRGTLSHTDSKVLAKHVFKRNADHACGRTIIEESMGAHRVRKSKFINEKKEASTSEKDAEKAMFELIAEEEEVSARKKYYPDLQSSKSSRGKKNREKR